MSSSNVDNYCRSAVGKRNCSRAALLIWGPSGAATDIDMEKLGEMNTKHTPHS